MARANESEYILARAGSLLLVVQTDIQSLFSLNEVLGSVADIDGSGSEGMGSGNEGLGSGKEGSGSGIGVLGSEGRMLATGSGQAEVEPRRQFATITSGLQSLVREIGQMEQRLMQQSDYLQATANISRFYQFAETLNMTLIPALDRGSISVNLILNYSDTLKTLEMAFNLSHQISAHLDNISNFITMALHENTSQLIAQISSLSDNILTASIVEHTNARNALASIQRARILANNSKSAEDEITTMRSNLALGLLSLSRNVSILSLHIHSILASIDVQVQSSLQVAINITRELPHFTATSFNIINQTRTSQEVYNTAGVNIDNANASLHTANNALEENVFALANSDIVNLADINAKKLEDLNMAHSNLSVEIRRAFAAAEMIDLALQFFGDSSLSYSTPSSLEDLESVSIVVKPSQTNAGIILSSGPQNHNEFIALEVENGSLQFRCNQEVLVHTGGELDSENWYQIYVTRENEELKMSLSSFPQNGSSYRGTVVLTNASCSLLDDVTYLGGGNLDTGFIGCIDRVLINGHPLPLFIPRERNVITSSCGVRPPLQNIRERAIGVWLLGAGSFINMGSVPTPSGNFTIAFLFRTFTPTGLLYVGLSNSSHQYLTISLYDGLLQIHIAVSAYDSPLYLTSNSTYNSGNWHQVVLSNHNGSITVAIDETEKLSGQISDVYGNEFLPFHQVFIGGLPEYIRSLLATTLPSLPSIAGCINELQVNELDVDLSQRDSNRVDFDGCPSEVVQGVRFTGEGLVEFDYQETRLYNLSFSYRSTQLSALLLQAGNLTISIFHTRIKVNIFNTTVLSAESGLSDNTHQSVLIDFKYSNSQTAVILTVSGGTPVNASIPEQYVLSNRIFVGGTNENEILERFRGCMNNLIVNGRVMDFNAAEVSYGVSLYGCHPPARPRVTVTPPSLPPPPPPLPPPPAQPPLMSEPRGLSGRNGAFLSFRVLEQDVISSFSLVLEFRSSSSDGLLIFMQDNTYLTDFLALQLRSGRLLFSFNLGSGSAKLLSEEEYNDGFLHRVELMRSGRTGQMIIDNGMEIVSGLSSGSFEFLNARSEYLFVGGLPEMFNREKLRPLASHNQLPVPVLACVSALAINGVFVNLSTPQAANDVESCLPVYTNLVTLQSNSYIQFFDNFDVGVTFSFSINFVTTNCSGLLLYVASSIYSDHLLVELRNGQIILVFDNGPQLETLKHTGSSLCDGRWHSLVITKSEQRGSISVDGREEQVVISYCDSCSQFSATNTNGPLYVGGLPEIARPRHTVGSRSFQGCFSNFRIKRGGQDYITVLFSQAQDHGNVQFNVCSTNY